MNRILILTVFAVCAMAQSRWPNTLRTSFPDGTGLEIHTESKGSTSAISTSGSVLVGSGGSVHRIVVDRQGAILFAYSIEARKASAGLYQLRIKPVNQQQIRKEFPKVALSQGPIATLATTRDFPPLSPGDEVQVDILQRPNTSEKIYDVIRVSNEAPPPPKPVAAKQNQFSFQSCRTSIAGTRVDEADRSWIIGGAAMILLPGKGSYYLALDPSPNYAFEPAGWVDRNILRFHAGKDLVEVECKSNVLQKTDYRTIWVYSEPFDTPTDYEMKRLLLRMAQLGLTYNGDHPDMKALRRQLESMKRAQDQKQPQYVEFRTADNVEYLIPKRERKND